MTFIRIGDRFINLDNVNQVVFSDSISGRVATVIFQPVIFVDIDGKPVIAHSAEEITEYGVNQLEHYLSKYSDSIA